ncbi:hypothetical protein MNB_SV-15-458 [hydrothermal vent metagenome]|uniref:Uncharacterized protein n=1 Tax=hydrothermal vent metagenome TaxID=652676 RepID=A0A1W1EIW9_9ZZZZ
MAISQDFAPPFRLIAPYFIIGVILFVISTALAFGFNITEISSSHNTTLAWVHIFLLGFVMMVIFGAMAQLVPVVLEVGHFAVDLYYVIYPLLLIGSILMAFGFLLSPALLPYGGIIVLISLLIFVYETFLTIKKVKKLNLVMTTVLIANTFLFLGLIFGILMALGYAGTIDINIISLLKAHIYLVLAGYVGITIMGMSLILLPMFWLSHSFSWKPVEYALWTMSIGVVWVMLSSILDSIVLEYSGYIMAIIALILYFYQIYLIYTTRVRMEKDIYLYSLLFSYSNLILALIMGVIYLIFPNENLLLAIGWTIFMGYIAFIINGHLYKIVPFLVWYQRFSPLIGKQKVPMLADMVPVRSAKMQFIFSSSGVILATFAILIASDKAFHMGVGFLLVGSIFMLKDLIYMIRFKG